MCAFPDSSRHPFTLNAQVSIPSSLYVRLRKLRRRLEASLHIRITDDELLDYLCRSALDKVEAWEADVFQGERFGDEAAHGPR